MCYSCFWSPCIWLLIMCSHCLYLRQNTYKLYFRNTNIPSCHIIFIHVLHVLHTFFAKLVASVYTLVLQIFHWLKSGLHKVFRFSDHQNLMFELCWNCNVDLFSDSLIREEGIFGLYITSDPMISLVHREISWSSGMYIVQPNGHYNLDKALVSVSE